MKNESLNIDGWPIERWGSPFEVIDWSDIIVQYAIENLKNS